MKKIIISSISILCVLLCACNQGSTDIPDSILQTESTTTPVITSFKTSEENPVTPPVSPACFNSFSELKNATDPQNEKNLFAYFEEQRVEGGQNEAVRAFVRAIRSYDNVVPYLNGVAIELIHKDGFPNIYMFASELYKLPWLWYSPNIPGENLYIKTTFLPESLLSKDNLTASKVIKELSPGSPNVGNTGERHKSIYENEIALSDRTVTALVIEYKTDKRNSTFFVYDNLIVEVRNDPEIWGTDWFSSLSFGAFPDEPEPSGNVQLNLDFTSIKEMYDTVTQEKLADWQKRHIAEVFPKDETGKTLMCDFDNLYEPALPENWTTNGASWYGPYYAFQIASGDKFGFVTWLPETLYSETFQRDYTDFFDNERITVTKTENEGGKEKTFYDTGMGGSMQERYVLYEGERTITVDKCYFLSVGSELVPDSEDVPVSVRLYCEEGEELFYTVMLYNFGSAPDDQLLKQFSMTPFDGS